MKLIPICAATAAILMTAGPVSAETLKIKVADVKPGRDLLSEQPIVTLTLGPESKAALATFTQARLGEQVKMRVGDTVLSAPVIREPIMEGTLVINGQLTDETAEDLARAILKAGGNVEIDGSDK